MGTVVGFLAIVVLLQICPILGSIPVSNRGADVVLDEFMTIP